jgi:hypothetical protein
MMLRKKVWARLVTLLPWSLVLTSLPSVVLLTLLPRGLQAQYNNQRPDAFDKANNTVNKVASAIAVFQPYLLKARQLFYDAKQMAGDLKRDARGVLRKDSSGAYNNNGGTYNGGSYSSNNGTYSSNNGSYNSNGGNTYSSNSGSGNSNNGSYNNNGSNSNNSSYGNGSNGSYGNGSNGSNGNNSSYGNGNNGSYGNNGGGYSNNPATYMQGQSLPINNPSTVNNDATGNWGNQNNGLYGNCLDALTGTVMGMGEAASSPKSVDLMFFAPADGQNTYHLMTPGFARNNGTATYMTDHTSDQVQQWTDVNESEVALTKLTIGQFNQIQNNGQIQNAARNAQGYSGDFSSVEQKLDGAVFAVRTTTDSREVFALVAVIKQLGTSGSNGYLKIAIKSTGVDLNHDGQADANAYLRGQ